MTQPQSYGDTKKDREHEASRDAEERGHKIAQQPAGADLFSKPLRYRQRRRKS